MSVQVRRASVLAADVILGSCGSLTGRPNTPTRQRRSGSKDAATTTGEVSNNLLAAPQESRERSTSDGGDLQRLHSKRVKNTVQKVDSIKKSKKWKSLEGEVEDETTSLKSTSVKLYQNGRSPTGSNTQTTVYGITAEEQSLV